MNSPVVDNLMRRVVALEISLIWETSGSISADIVAMIKRERAYATTSGIVWTDDFVPSYTQESLDDHVMDGDIPPWRQGAG